MRRPIHTLALAFAFAALCASALAAGAATPSALTVALRESRRVVLRGVASTIVVGDPNVADVTLTDTHSIILIGRGYGTTQLMVTDAAGRTLLDSQVSVVAPDAGRVTFYRGLSASDYACGGGRCRPAGRGEAAGGGDSAASPGGGQANAPTVQPASPTP